MKPWRDQRGFTIVEVLVAAAVLVVGVVGVSGAFSVAFTDVVASSGESKATAYARQQLEALKNEPFATVRALNGTTVTDTPEPQFDRTRRVDLGGRDPSPQRGRDDHRHGHVAAGSSRSKTIIPQTNRRQWG